MNYEYSREKPGPMNLSHTDLTNLTDGASLRPRLSASPSVFSRMVHTPTRSISVGCDDGRFIFPKECGAKGVASTMYAFVRFVRSV